MQQKIIIFIKCMHDMFLYLFKIYQIKPQLMHGKYIHIERDTSFRVFYDPTNWFSMTRHEFWVLNSTNFLNVQSCGTVSDTYAHEHLKASNIVEYEYSNLRIIVNTSVIITLKDQPQPFVQQAGHSLLQVQKLVGYLWKINRRDQNLIRLSNNWSWEQALDSIIWR